MIDEDWLQNSDVYSLFPTLVWKIQLPAEIVANQNPTIINAIRKINPKIDDIEKATSWQSHHSFNPMFNEFAEKLSKPLWQPPQLHA